MMPEKLAPTPLPNGNYFMAGRSAVGVQSTLSIVYFR